MSPGVRFLAALALLSHAAVFAQPDPYVRSAWQILNADLFLMALDANGDIYVAGRTNEPGFRPSANAYQTRPGGGVCQTRACNDVVIAKIRASDGQVVAATLLGGSGEDSPTAIHVDRFTGAVFVAGTSTSRTISWLENAFQRASLAPLASSSSSFVARLNSSLTALDYGTFLGGRGTDRISAITADSQGFAYVTGVAESANFPTTPGAFRTTHAPGSVFVTRLNSGGTALVASTFLGQGSAAGISLDIQGNVIVTGSTSSSGFPTTPNAYQTEFRRGDGFIVRMPPSLHTITYSTLLGGSQNDLIVDSDIDVDGNVYVVGTTFSRDFPVTVTDASAGDAGTVFVAKFGAASLAYSRVLRGNNAVSATSIEVNRDGSVNVAGYSTGSHFPTTAGAYRRCVPAALTGTQVPFYTRLNREGGFLYSTLLHDSVYESRQWFSTLASGEFYVLTFVPVPNLPISNPQPPPNLLRRLDPNAAVSRVDCVVNAATYSAASVAPGLIVTIFGSGLGPAEGAGGTIENGRVTTSAGGVRVLFDGIPAPVLFARRDQVNAIVPFAIAGRNSTQMTVEYSGASTSATLAVRPTSAGIFRLGATEQAVILNEDGSVNTPENPAARNSVITFWITGYGQYLAAATDGTVTGSELSPINLPFALTIQNQPAEVLYAGSAPGMVAGAAQVNARIPASSPASLRVPITLTVGNDGVQNSAFVSLK
jgi:uncharacterized protein (TIGR03437 family)